MPRFQYTARNAGGTLVKGDLDAASRREAIRQIGLRNLYPVSLSDGGGAATRKATSRKSKAAGREKSSEPSSRSGAKEKKSSRPRFGGSKLSPRNALPFLRSLSELISSGMPVGDAVRLLSVRLKDPQLRQLATSLWENISSGQSISDAVAEAPEVFEESTVHLIRAGEATGNLEEILRRLVAYHENRNALRGKVVNALAYPLFIILVAVGVILFFIYFLFPRMETLFDSLGGEIPAATQLLIDGSEFLMAYGLFILVAVILVVLGIWQWYGTESGRLRIDEWLLKVPGVRDFIIVNDVLQMSQTLGALLENGVTTVEALKMTENVLNNRRIRESFNEARGMVVEGTSLSGALQASENFPELVLDMLDVGENTGNIVPSLKEISRLYQERLTRHLQIFTAFLSIGVLIMAVVFVAFIAFAIFTAVFQLSSGF
jgi:type II secretory pathway component PulF